MESVNDGMDNQIKEPNFNHINDRHPPNNNLEVVFAGKKSGSDFNRTATPISHPNHISSCRTLQRKLEMKVERARRNYSHFNQKNSNKNEEIQVSAPSASANLIPITRLQIPGIQECVPLVEYRSENSEEDEVISTFFPNKSKVNKRLDLSDNFSIQEMTIESDSGDDSGDSQNLELLPPTVRIQFLDRLINYFCCSNSEL